MDRLANFLNEPAVRFGIITALGFIILRLILGVINDYVEFPSWTANILALLLAGWGAYWVIYQSKGR